MGIWDFKTFECGQNPIMCLWSWCVPCGGACMQALDAKLTDADNKNAALVACLLACCCGCFGAAFNRYKIREKLKIEDTVIMDILCSWCCPCCSVTQEWQTVMKHKKGNNKLLIWDLSEKKKEESRS